MNQSISTYCQATLNVSLSGTCMGSSFSDEGNACGFTDSKAQRERFAEHSFYHSPSSDEGNACGFSDSKAQRERFAEYYDFSTTNTTIRDEETGFGYFGARYYDSELLTGWLSVDPMSDKYPSLSPYAYCAWNPVKLADPDGREFGDYYSESGKYLGCDGLQDSKVYIVPSWKRRAVKKGNYDVEKYELPSFDVRNKMCDYLEASDNNDNLREYGGTIWENDISGEQELRCSLPGEKWNGTGSASVATNEYGKDEFNASRKSLLTFFHSHFSGKINGLGLRQFPSGGTNDNQPGDIENVMKDGKRFAGARLPYNIMVAMKDKKFFLYTGSGVKVIMKIDTFKTVGGPKQ